MCRWVRKQFALLTCFRIWYHEQRLFDTSDVAALSDKRFLWVCSTYYKRSSCLRPWLHFEERFSNNPIHTSLSELRHDSNEIWPMNESVAGLVRDPMSCGNYCWWLATPHSSLAPIHLEIYSCENNYLQIAKNVSFYCDLPQPLSVKRTRMIFFQSICVCLADFC